MSVNAPASSPVASDRTIACQAGQSLESSGRRPIVSKDSVFLAVATEDGRKRSLHCYDRNTGETRWVRTVEFDGKEPTHKTNPYAGSTPVADGDRVVVWHSSAGMYCIDE